MSERRPIRSSQDDFEEFSFQHKRRAFPEYRSGDGPAIFVMHELPGMLFETIEFARRLRDAGYCVYLPLFFGPPAREAFDRLLAFFKERLSTG